MDVIPTQPQSVHHAATWQLIRMYLLSLIRLWLLNSSSRLIKGQLAYLKICIYFEGLISNFLFTPVLLSVNFRSFQLRPAAGWQSISEGKRNYCLSGFFPSFVWIVSLVATYWLNTYFKDFWGELFVHSVRWAALDSPAPNTPYARSTSSMLWVSADSRTTYG